MTYFSELYPRNPYCLRKNLTNTSMSLKYLISPFCLFLFLQKLMFWDFWLYLCLYNINCHSEPNIRVGFLSVWQDFRNEACFLGITKCSFQSFFTQLFHIMEKIEYSQQKQEASNRRNNHRG